MLLIPVSFCIICPACKQKQRMDSDENIYFPVSPYCCEVMQYRDTKEWNTKLDEAIRKAILN